MKRLLVLFLLVLFGCSSGDDRASLFPIKDASIDTTDTSAPDTGKPTYDASSKVPPPGAFDESSADPTPIDYHGGRVLTSPINVYIVWYGAWSANTVYIVEYFINHLGATPYYAVNTAYYQAGDGSPPNRDAGIILDAGDIDTSVSADATSDVVSAFNQSDYYVNNNIRIVDSWQVGYPNGTILTEEAIPYIILNELQSIPLAIDPNGVYFFLTSKDVVVGPAYSPWSAGFCSNYCGWHQVGLLGDQELLYAFVGSPDQCQDECGMEYTYTYHHFNRSPNNNWEADAIVSVIGHELIEMATDPGINAWQSPDGEETMDHCAWVFGTLYMSDNNSIANVKVGDKDFLIQEVWNLSLPDGGQGCSLQ